MNDRMAPVAPFNVDDAAGEALEAARGAVAQAQVAALTAMLHNRYVKTGRYDLPDVQGAARHEIALALFFLKFDREPDEGYDRTWNLFRNALRSDTLDQDEDTLWAMEIRRREDMEDRRAAADKLNRDGF